VILLDKEIVEKKKMELVRTIFHEKVPIATSSDI